MAKPRPRAPAAAAAPAESPLHSVSFARGVSVFLAGAVALFIEIAGARLLAVIFGSSLYVWSALITVTLLSIATGAWWGGRVADRWPTPRTLSLLFLGAALGLSVAVPLRQLAIPLADAIDLRIGAFLTALLLFFVPLALLSAVPPVAVKLSDPLKDNLGRVVGRVSALGTAGSCAGALATGFFLVPAFPLTRLFLYASLALAVYGAALGPRGRRTATTLAALVWTGALLSVFPDQPTTALGRRPNATIVDVLQNLHGQTQIMQFGPARLLFLDGVFQGGLYLTSGNSTSEYTSAMEVLGMSAVPAAKRILVIGLGAAILPSRFVRAGLDVDAVDVDPDVVESARRWFDPQLPPRRLHAGDGRRYLRESGATFDLIFLDAFSGEEIPVHLVTREAFEDARARLAPIGALIVNYVGFFQTPSRSFATILATLRDVFPSVEAFTVGDSGPLCNFVIVARKTPGDWTPTPDVPWGKDKRVTLQGARGKPVDETAAPYPFLLTDDYCPLDWLDRDVRFAWRREKIKAMHLLSATGS